MHEKEILSNLREIQKNKATWKDNISIVVAKLNESESIEVKAKALWILGEMGLKHSYEIKEYVEEIARYIDNNNPKLRQRSLNAVGRIGRGDKNLIIPYLDKIMNRRNDNNGDVRLSFVWACENIATNAPEMFCNKLDIFYDLISDSYEKVRIEAPEIFRVIGKQKPKCIEPYLKKLEEISRTDTHPIVRIHCEGALRVTKKALESN